MLEGLGVTQTQFKTQLQNEYNAMVAKVYEHEGFYIGRYETSLNGASMQSKANQPPMTAATTSGNKWWGMYKIQKLYNSNNKMTSSMIWGSQWDQVMIWMKDEMNTVQSKPYILDSIGMGWYADNYSAGNLAHTTGIPVGDHKNRIKNIYDMAGNEEEWTIVAGNTTGRVCSGRQLQL